jgi:hypothetical protein
MPNQNNIISCVARTKILVALPIILQSFLLYYSKWILEKYLLQNPKSQRMERWTRKREREREREMENQVA